MQISDLIKQAITKHIVDPSDDYIESLIKRFQSPGHCLFYNENGFIAGMVTDQHILFPGVRVALEVAWWVDPEARGKMTGGRLYKQFEAWAEEFGCHHIFQGIETKGSRKFSEVYIKDIV